jgi:hypothetical protein
MPTRFRPGKNSAWNEGLGRTGRLHLRCFSTGKACRKFSQNADFAYYLDCLPPKHTFFQLIIWANVAWNFPVEAILRHSVNELANVTQVA